MVRADAGTNGLAVDASGPLYGASHKRATSLRTELGASDEAPVELPTAFGSIHRTISRIRSDGVIYFTDPSYRRRRRSPSRTTRPYRWSVGAGIAALADLAQPNGVDPPARRESALRRDVGQRARIPGQFRRQPRERRHVRAGGSDGMGLDCAGNLYVTRGTQVIVFSANGAELGRIGFPDVQSVTNVAFGGADRTVLYVTALGSGTKKGSFG